MLCIGLDPSITGLGWAVHAPLEEGSKRLVAKGTFASPSAYSFVQRYVGLRECIRDLLLDYPEAKVLGAESPPFGAQWSEGLYALYVYVAEAVYLERRDIVYFDPSTLKMLAKGDPTLRKGKMFKTDMVDAAKADTGGKGRWNHNEADAYIAAKSAAQFWNFRSGRISEVDLTPAERQSFTRVHTFTKGAREGQTDRKGLVYREDDRFFLFSKVPSLVTRQSQLAVKATEPPRGQDPGSSSR